MDNRLVEANCLTTPEQCPAECQSRETSESCFTCECATSEGAVQPALEYTTIQFPVSCPVTCVKQMSSQDVPRCHCPSHGVCKLPLQEGNCNAKIPRYFFNVTSGFCDVFTYTGCGGNENNFASHEECLAECEVPDLIVDISFHGWPPYVAAGEFLAPYDTWMSLMYLLRDWKLQFWWHHHSHSKHQAPFGDRQLTASVKGGITSGEVLVCWRVVETA
ncbi:hypothetical protein MTO96_012726 [Rhipicephalus appendiculatus]